MSPEPDQRARAGVAAHRQRPGAGAAAGLRHVLQRGPEPVVPLPVKRLAGTGKGHWCAARGLVGRVLACVALPWGVMAQGVSFGGPASLLEAPPGLTAVSPTPALPEVPAWPLAQAPANGSVPEVRGTWLTTTANDALATPQRTAQTMRRLREIGLNTVMFVFIKSVRRSEA